MVQTAFAERSEELVKKLANPIASLISVPFQANYDSDIGPNDKGDRYVLNMQPVIPISMNDDWNVISRTIHPVVSQDDIFPGADKWGIGPTAVLLKQNGPWTYGALVNHIWSVAGDDDRQDVSVTFLQPF